MVSVKSASITTSCSLKMTTSSVTYIWKRPNLFQSGRTAILVTDSQQGVEPILALFERAIELVNEDVDQPDPDLNGDGVVDMVEIYVILLVRTVKQYLGLFYRMLVKFRLADGGNNGKEGFNPQLLAKLF